MREESPAYLWSWKFHLVQRISLDYQLPSHMMKILEKDGLVLAGFEANIAMCDFAPGIPRVNPSRNSTVLLFDGNPVDRLRLFRFAASISSSSLTLRTSASPMFPSVLGIESLRRCRTLFHDCPEPHHFTGSRA